MDEIKSVVAISPEDPIKVGDSVCSLGNHGLVALIWTVQKVAKSGDVTLVRPDLELADNGDATIRLLHRELDAAALTNDSLPRWCIVR